MTRPHELTPDRSPILCLFALALAACGSGADEPAQAEDRDGPSAEVASGSSQEAPRAECSDSVLFETRQRAQAEWKADNILRRDPGFDGWPSEVLHERAKGALKHFLDALVHPDDDGPGWEELLAESFRGATPLRPAELRIEWIDFMGPVGPTRAGAGSSRDHPAPTPGTPGWP